jgi:diguanylate cyclase (GGDEF)-like protein
MRTEPSFSQTADGAHSDTELDFHQMFESMPAAAFIIDVGSNRIVYGNQAAVHLSGFNRTQLTRKKPTRLFPRSELGRFWENPGADGEFIGWILTRHKAEIPISALAHVVESASGPACILLAFDITELKLGNDLETERVRQDSLTGLLNREEFEREFDALLRLERGAHSMGVLYIDLDDLKRINDACGHAQGDAVLVAFSQRLRSSCLDAALVARYGSDEFIVVYEDLPAGLLDARREISRRVEMLQQDLRLPYLLDSRTIVASCSIGLALDPHDADSRESLLGCADLALQQAKRNGRDSFRFFIESDLRRLNEEIEVEATLREVIRYEAVEQSWLPLFNVQNETCIGIESLLRGGELLRGVDTARIVEIAQARGLLPDLGRLNVRRSANAFKRLVLSGRDTVVRHICLNVSAQELLSPRFVDELMQVAETAALPLDRIMVEIGELDLFSSIDRLRPALQLLHGRNVQLAIDGFGSGFSSLYLLRDLPIDMIKIDRRFIWQLEASKRDREIVQAMIHLAHSLGMKVTAVGVETRAQLDALREMGCDNAQGYLLSRPLLLDDLSDFLRRYVMRTL